jgi:hypothetical protein
VRRLPDVALPDLTLSDLTLADLALRGRAQPGLAAWRRRAGGLAVHEVVAHTARHHQIARDDPQLATLRWFPFDDVAGADGEPGRKPGLGHD